MNAGHIFININSERPEELIAFYGDVVQLPRSSVVDGAFEAGGALIGIDRHSEIKRLAKEPARILISLGIKGLKDEQARLERAGVKFVRKEGREPWGAMISTFLDPDGNYCQLVEASAPAGTEHTS